MTRLYSSLLLLCATLAVVSYADLVADLTQNNITILSPGQDGYSTSSTAYNLRFTFQPAVIAFPNTPQDVSTVMKIAQQFNYQVVARSGGHSYIANGLGGRDGSVVVDMSNFVEISVNSTTFIATIGPGNRVGDVALGLNNAGRALPHGTCPYLGMGGHSGYGGYGFTSRKWGLTLDTIQSLEVVLANGTIATASLANYPDLFFALRGASGSFGIVTSIQVTTFAAPASATVFTYTWDFSAAEAANATQQFQNYVQGNIPQEFAAELDVGKGSASGRVAFSLAGGWYGPADDFDAIIAPYLDELPPPSAQTITPGTYIESVQNLGGLGRLNTNGIPDSNDTFYAKSLMTPEASPMTSTALNAFMSYLGDVGFTADTSWFVQFELYGGTNSAINNVPLNATAFAHRSSLFTIQFYTSAPGNVPPFPDDGFTLLDGMVSSILNNEPSDWDYGAYTNYIDDLLVNWQTLYYGPHYPVLERLKGQYDPLDTFNFPLSIQE